MDKVVREARSPPLTRSVIFREHHQCLCDTHSGMQDKAFSTGRLLSYLSTLTHLAFRLCSAFRKQQGDIPVCLRNCTVLFKINK